jgi:hypothetical protein
VRLKMRESKQTPTAIWVLDIGFSFKTHFCAAADGQ